jgi:polyhydroxyalkanoate synthesis regulator phasin
MTSFIYRTISMEIKDGIYDRIINGYSGEEQLNQVVRKSINNGSLTKDEAAKLKAELIERIKKMNTKNLSV